MTETAPAPGTREHVLRVALWDSSSRCPEFDPASSLKVAEVPLASASTTEGACAAFTGAVPIGADFAWLQFTNRYGDAWANLGALLAARAATPVGHELDALPAGQEIVLAWSPPADLVNAYSTTATFGDQPVTAIAMEDGVHLTLPADASGSQLLRVALGVRGSCGSRCAYDVQQRIEIQAAIAE